MESTEPLINITYDQIDCLLHVSEASDVNAERSVILCIESGYIFNTTFEVGTFLTVFAMNKTHIKVLRHAQHY